MKKSTLILGTTTLTLAVAVVYFYLKSKKLTNTTSGSSTVVDASLGLSPTTTTNTSTTTQTPPKATIDTVISIVSETQTENYKKAKVLSKDIEVFMVELKDLQKIYDGFHYSTSSRSFASFDVKNKKKQISDKTAQANALGYKILPYGEIEKM